MEQKETLTFVIVVLRGKRSLSRCCSYSGLGVATIPDLAPAFYLSEFLEGHREEYYLRLGEVSKKKNWQDWIMFFLKAVEFQADKNTNVVKATLHLYNSMKTRISDQLRSTHVIQIMDAMFSKPIFKSSDLAPLTELDQEYCRSCISKLKKTGIVVEIREKKGPSPTVYGFSELLQLTNYGQFNAVKKLLT